MVKKYKKEPFSFSFSPQFVKSLKYYLHTHSDSKLSQEVETYLKGVIPEYKSRG